jgi:hypothetical protein
LQANAGELEVGLTGTAAPRFGHDFSRVLVHPPAPGAIQTKLSINQPGDGYEQEADRVAGQVIRIPEAQQRACACGGACPECQIQQVAREHAQTKRVQANDSAEMVAPPIVHDVIRSSGQLLEQSTRAFFEPRFGFDFSRVRIHHDQDAAESAREFGAYAYTVANHIVFGAGRYAPQRPDGKRLLAHELTHVMQQSASSAPRLQDQERTERYAIQQPVAMFAGIAPVEALIPAASHRVLRQPEAGEESTKQTAEEKERAKLLTEFTGGAELPEQQVSRIASAMRAFSLRQLQAMRKAGVRFWAPDSLPLEFKDHVEVENVSTPGQYLDTLRLIRMAKNASTDSIRHEMAHAWDHVRTGKVKPIAGLKGEEFDKALKDTPALSSETEEKRATKETHQGKVRSVRIPISEMFERYKKWKLREQSFDNPSTREGYSKTSPKEFYAEGYSVFHGGREWNQARLLYYAPELYELLEAEAKQQGLSVPDRSKIEAALKEQKLQ